MNITMNDLLIKKINFAGGETSGTVAENPVPAQDPQQGMKALMFQGMKNLMSNPMLAKEVGVEGEGNGEAADAKSYVAPYSTNIAFGNKSKMAKTALAGLAVVAAGASVTSCKPSDWVPKSETYQSVTMNVEQMDNSVLMAMLQEIKALRQDINNRDARDAERDKKLDTIIDLLSISVTTQQDEATKNEIFRNYVMGSQAEIIKILTDRGLSQDKALALFNQKMDALIKGQLTILQFVQWITGYVKNIDKNVASIRQTLETHVADTKEIAQKYLNGQAEMFAMVYQGFNDVSSDLQTLNATLTERTARIENAINNQTLQLTDVIENNVDKLAEQMDMTREELIAELRRLGLSTNCTLQQLLAAERAELAVNTQILNKVSALYNKFAKAEINANQFVQELMKILNEINSGVQSIASTVNGMADTLNKLFASFQDLKKQSLMTLGGIYMNGVINNAQMAEANRLAKLELNEIKAIRVELKSLDPAQLKQIITEAVQEGTVDIKTAIEAKGIDYDKLNAMFKMLGKDITSAVNMSTEELKALIENFDKNVMGAEEAQAQKLTEILEAIKGVELSPELKAALQALMNAVNSGAQNITNELNKVEELLGTISDKIDGLQETLDDIAANVRSIKTQVTLYNTYWTKALAGIDELVEIGNQLKAGQGDIKTLIAQAYAKMDEIIENQQKSNEYAKKAEADRAIIIEKLDKYKGIDYDQLEAMWKEHDNANFVRLEALLKSLGIDPAKFESVADLIAAINEKMQYIKDNERILKEISDKMDLIKAALDNLDPSSQEYKDYTAKLNRIIELLENFKCNCECNCGKSNEGIIDELNNLMNGDGNNAREYRAARRSAARHK